MAAINNFIGNIKLILINLVPEPSKQTLDTKLTELLLNITQFLDKKGLSELKFELDNSMQAQLDDYVRKVNNIVSSFQDFNIEPIINLIVKMVENYIYIKIKIGYSSKLMQQYTNEKMSKTMKLEQDKQKSQELSAKIDKLEQEKGELEKQLVEKQSEVRQKIEQHEEAIKQQKVAVEKQLADVQQQNFATAAEKTAAIAAATATHKQQMDALAEQLKQLTVTGAQTKNDLEVQHEQLIKRRDARIKELETALNEANKSVARLEERVQELETKIAEKEASIMRTKNALPELFESTSNIFKSSTELLKGSIQSLQNNAGPPAGMSPPPIQSTKQMVIGQSGTMNASSLKPVEVNPQIRIILSETVKNILAKPPVDEVDNTRKCATTYGKLYDILLELNKGIDGVNISTILDQPIYEVHRQILFSTLGFNPTDKTMLTFNKDGETEKIKNILIACHPDKNANDKTNTGEITKFLTVLKNYDEKEMDKKKKEAQKASQPQYLMSESSANEPLPPVNIKIESVEPENSSAASSFNPILGANVPNVNVVNNAAAAGEISIEKANQFLDKLVDPWESKYLKYKQKYLELKSRMRY